MCSPTIYCPLVAKLRSSSSVYLKAACKEVQFREEHRISIQSLQTQHTLETHFRCLMTNGKKNTEGKLTPKNVENVPDS